MTDDEIRSAIVKEHVAIMEADKSKAHAESNIKLLQQICPHTEMLKVPCYLTLRRCYICGYQESAT